MSKIKDHLSTTFIKSLPRWIDLDSPVLIGIETSLTEIITSLIENYIYESDFLSSIKAKLYKQDDYAAKETFDIEAQFPRKYRNIFRRGSEQGEEEIRRLLIADTSRLYYDTELYYETPLGEDVQFEVTKSKDVTSGWIANVTYPSINKVALQADDAQDANEYVFSQKDFLLITAQNKSNLSNESLEEYLRQYFLPFSIPTLFTFIK